MSDNASVKNNKIDFLYCSIAAEICLYRSMECDRLWVKWECDRNAIAPCGEVETRSLVGEVEMRSLVASVCTMSVEKLQLRSQLS
jgi:hypothetical protein